MEAIPSQLRYVLITPARNEAAFIEKTIESMVRQTVLPLKWVIVDDGSTDATADIVRRYEAQNAWIELVQRPPRQDRNFAGKVHAFNAGFERVREIAFDLIGNLDGDITFDADHFEFLTGKFCEDPSLGVAGTAYTQPDWDSTQDSYEGWTAVAGACQLFRHRCFMEIGGYHPNPAGGIDWIAVTTARMKGWKTRSFPEKRWHHPRTMGTVGRSLQGAMFDYGKKDYFLGGSPVWELFRCAYQMTKQPLITGGLALMMGYCWAAIRVPRAVSPDLMRYHRREQMMKLRSVLRALLRLKRPEKFSLSG